MAVRAQLRADPDWGGGGLQKECYINSAFLRRIVKLLSGNSGAYLYSPSTVKDFCKGMWFFVNLNKLAADQGPYVSPRLF